MCWSVTHRWESDDRSLKAPSGISDMSLPWRDLDGHEKVVEREKRSTEKSVCVTFSKLSTTSHVLGLILTTNEET